MEMAPRRRDESIISKNIFIQFVTMGIYITALSILWFTMPVFRTFFETDAQFKTGYFALFMIAAIVNGFNVRTDNFNIFKDLDKNPNFLKVWLAMLIATVAFCMIDIIPALGFIGEMFNTTHFGIQGWGIVLALSVSMIPVDMLRKAIFKTYKNE